MNSIPHAPIVAAEKGERPAAFWWSLAAVLLSFLCLSHLFVMISFVLGQQVSPVVAPAALLVAIAAGDWLGRREGLKNRQRLAVSGLAFAIVGASILLAGSLFDMSWDGLWYHQTAVYQMAHGWNPLTDPMHDFVPHLQDWLRHYAKGPWYVALALYVTSGSIEAAKAAPWITLAATLSGVFAAANDLGFSRGKALVVASLATLNPVTVFELASYLVDGLMISFLAVFVAALVRWIRRPSPVIVWIMSASMILCINAKLTGLVYLSFACAAGGVYVLIRRRDIAVRYVTMQFALVLAGTVIFGFNPYVTNWIHRGHPFYPVLGTAQYPSLGQQGEDPIERFETPHNMMGRNRVVRMAYALFGRPGAQPFFPGFDARLMIPFDVGLKDFAIYYFHDVRISGFGPLFSGAFLLSLVVIGIALGRSGAHRVIMLIVVVAIALSLLISAHTWWARYGPQLWWIPILALIVGFSWATKRAERWIAWVLAILLAVNVVPIAIVHYRWEVDATRTTQDQVEMLRGKKNIEVDFQYFAEPFGERLKSHGVMFVPVQKLRCQEPIELMSVSPGYPCAVRACFED